MKFLKWFNVVVLIFLIFVSSILAQSSSSSSSSSSSNTNVITPPSAPVVSVPISVPIPTLTDSALPFIPLFSPGNTNQVRFITNTNGAAPILTNVTVGLIQSQGSSATFSAKAISSNTVSYQWYKSNGDPIANGNKATITLANIQPSDEGWYYVTAVNSYGEAVSATTLCVTYTNILSQCSPTNTVLLTFGWNYDFVNNPNTVGFNLYDGTNKSVYTSMIPIRSQITNTSIPLPMNSNTYYFSLTAVDTNGLESTNSQQAVFFSTLSILKQFNVSVLMLTTGIPKIQMQVCPFQTITLQYSTNLMSWAPMKVLVADKYGNVLWDDLDPKRNSLRFYRVMTQ